jgi:hypothetical protein
VAEGTTTARCRKVLLIRINLGGRSTGLSDNPDNEANIALKTKIKTYKTNKLTI